MRRSAVCIPVSCYNCLTKSLHAYDKAWRRWSKVLGDRKLAYENEVQCGPEFTDCACHNVRNRTARFRGTSDVAAAQAFSRVSPGKYALPAFPGRSGGGALGRSPFALLGSGSRKGHRMAFAESFLNRNHADRPSAGAGFRI